MLNINDITLNPKSNFVFKLRTIFNSLNSDFVKEETTNAVSHISFLSFVFQAFVWTRWDLE